MITVTRFDGTNVVVNADLIEFVEATPDTILSMTTGRKLIILESPQEVIQAVEKYKQRLMSGPTEKRESAL